MWSATHAEYCENGVLRYDEALDEARLWDWIEQIARGLERIHACGIVHKDIKPDNILVSSGNVLKIGDFGIAARLSGGLPPKAEEGDNRYLAPEAMVRALLTVARYTQQLTSRLRTFSWPVTNPRPRWTCLRSALPSSSS
jgi:serine/threonine protein kinase